MITRGRKNKFARTGRVGTYEEEERRVRFTRTVLKFSNCRRGEKEKGRRRVGLREGDGE